MRARFRVRFHWQMTHVICMSSTHCLHIIQKCACRPHWIATALHKAYWLPCFNIVYILITVCSCCLGTRCQQIVKVGSPFARETINIRAHVHQASALRQLCYDTSNTLLIAMTLAILFSLKTIGLLENGVKMTPLFSMRTVSIGSLQSCRSVDSDARCKRALIRSCKLFSSYLSTLPCNI